MGGRADLYDTRQRPPIPTKSSLQLHVGTKCWLQSGSFGHVTAAVRLIARGMSALRRATKGNFDPKRS